MSNLNFAQTIEKVLMLGSNQVDFSIPDEILF